MSDGRRLKRALPTLAEPEGDSSLHKALVHRTSSSRLDCARVSKLARSLHEVYDVSCPFVPPLVRSVHSATLALQPPPPSAEATVVVTDSVKTMFKTLVPAPSSPAVRHSEGQGGSLPKVADVAQTTAALPADTRLAASLPATEVVDAYLGVLGIRNDRCTAVPEDSVAGAARALETQVPQSPVPLPSAPDLAPTRALTSPDIDFLTLLFHPGSVLVQGSRQRLESRHKDCRTLPPPLSAPR